MGAVIRGSGGVGRRMRVLDARYSCLESWRALSIGIGELRKLHMFFSESLGDDGVEDALEAVPHLEELHLGGGAFAGNRTAAEIAQHRRFSRIWIVQTATDDAGSDELRRNSGKTRLFRPRRGGAWVGESRSS